MNRFKSKISLNKVGNISYKRAIVVQIIELSAKEIAGVASFSSNAKIAFKSFPVIFMFIKIAPFILDLLFLFAIY